MVAKFEGIQSLMFEYNHKRQETFEIQRGLSFSVGGGSLGGSFPLLYALAHRAS